MRYAVILRLLGKPLPLCVCVCIRLFMHVRAFKNAKIKRNKIIYEIVPALIFYVIISSRRIRVTCNFGFNLILLLIVTLILQY